MLENKQYKLIIAYDGYDFSGWQIQKNGLSVANAIEQAFAGVFKRKIHLIGASRTDAGVHALGQVATFFTDLSLEPDTLKRALQAALPASVFIRSCERVPDSFHPRFDVVQKTYHYTVHLHEPLPWKARYGYFHESALDRVILRQALKIFEGTHDFRSFCSGNEYTTTIRALYAVEMVENEGSLTLVFKAKGFLRYMIRRLVGASLDVASGKYTLQDIHVALEQKNPNQRFMMAPPHGLMLYHITY